MGSVFSFNDSGLEPNELLEVQAETGFSKGNIKRLLSRFKHLDKDSKGYLIKEDLLSIPEVTLSYPNFYEQYQNMAFVLQLLDSL